MAADTGRRRDPYSSRTGRADRDRRRVRSRGRRVGFSNQSGSSVRAPARPRAVGIRRPKRGRKGQATGLLAALAAVATVVALIVQTLLMVVLAVVGWGLTALVGFIEFRADLADIRRQAKIARTSPQSGSQRPRSGSRAPGRKSAPKPGAGGGAKPPPKSGPKRTRACDRRCQESVKPVSTCRCSCNGTQHGSKRPKV